MAYNFTHTPASRLITFYSSDGTDGYDARGDTLENGYNFDDMKTVARSLDVSYCDENDYIFDCKFYFDGGNVESCYVYDLNKTVVMRPVLTTFTQFSGGLFYMIQAGGVMQFGKIIDETNKATSDGCNFIVDGEAFGVGMLGAYSTAYVKLFSSKIKSTKLISTLGNTAVNRGIVYAWNTTFESTQPYGIETTSDFFNVNFTDSYLCFYYGAGAADGITINNCSYVARIRRPSYSGTVYNSKILNTGIATFYANCDADSYFRFVDCFSDNWRVAWALYPANTNHCYRDYSFNLNLLTEDGTPIEGGSVHIIDALGEQETTLETDINGDIVNTEFNVYTWENCPDNVQNEYDKNPFTITISKEGYQSTTLKYNILEKQELTIGLIENIPPIYYQDSLEGDVESETATGNVTEENVQGNVTENHINGNIT